MKFGVRAGDAPAYNPNSGTSGEYVRYLKYFTQKATTLRYLEEPDEWTKVFMHYNQEKKREYPCTDDFATCPGHNSAFERERSTSVRYIVNALDTETGYVDLFKIPSSIYDDFVRFRDKFGTIKDRDYTVYKSGEGKEKTSYSVDREEPFKLDLSKYKLATHNDALEEVFREVWGGTPEEPGYRGMVYGGDDDFTPDGYLKPVEPGEPSIDLPKREQKWEDKFPADPPSEPAAQRDEEQQEVEITEAELRAMTAAQVIDIYKRAGIAIPTFSDKDELVDQLISALS